MDIGTVYLRTDLENVWESTVEKFEMMWSI